MRNLLILLLLTSHALSADVDLTLAREMLEDVLIRNDVDGMALARERLLRIAADTDDRTAARDAHYLYALSAYFELFSGLRDQTARTNLIVSGMRHADRAVDLDPQFADGLMLSGVFRGFARRSGLPAPQDPPGAPNRGARATELDANSPAVAFFNGVFASFNPAGPAPAAGVKLIDDFAARLDAERATTGRRFGIWDAQAHAWTIFVRIASESPRHEELRRMAARLLDERPDFALGRRIADMVAERRFVSAPAFAWQPVLTDPANDGSNPKFPDVVSVDRAEAGDMVWYRVTAREPLPRSFGVNLIFDRDGDPTTGMPWWGTGSTFRFDRLVTAWITRDGDRYAGTVGVTDDDGARGAQLLKIPADIRLAMADGDRSLLVGVPRSALGLTDKSAMIAAAGSHLAWNDDATSTPKSR
jgi:hypothetical protein